MILAHAGAARNISSVAADREAAAAAGAEKSINSVAADREADSSRNEGIL